MQARGTSSFDAIQWLNLGANRDLAEAGDAARPTEVSEIAALGYLSTVDCRLSTAGLWEARWFAVSRETGNTLSPDRSS